MTREERERARAREAKEARARHHAEEQEAKAQKKSKYDEAQRKKQEERERKEKEVEDAVKKMAEAKAKAEEDEFKEWSSTFAVTTAGSGESDVANTSQSLLSDFIHTIKARKVVLLEDLASEYRMRTSDVVTRIEALESNGMITGVMDERGKFIYLTEEEMTRVANFINRRGRVSISDIVAESNKLITLSSQEKERPAEGAAQAAVSDEEKKAAEAALAAQITLAS
jgi:hypothetical protein